MIQLEQIKNYFPYILHENTDFKKHILKEYIQLMVLNFLSSSVYVRKIETQDQQVLYKPVIANIQGCGYFFPFPVPSDGVLCSMKIAAMLARAKGRDFYDLMFLLSQTQPDYDFLEKRCGICNLQELQEKTTELLKITDLNVKKRDFEHLLFSKASSEQILRFREFIQSLNAHPSTFN